MPNNTFIELRQNDPYKMPCNGGAEFRVTQITPRSTGIGNADFGIKTSSIVINLVNGVVGQGFSKITQITDLVNSMDVNYNVRCLDSSESFFGENQTLSIIKENSLSNYFYDIQIDDTAFGTITSDSYYFGSKPPIEKNSTFLIVTGADACDAYGAYRMVNVNFKESEEGFVLSEIDISSLFFGRTKILDDNGSEEYDYLVVGDGKISKTIQTTTEDLPAEIKLDNDVKCINKDSDFTDEKFELTINNEGIGNLNLPPIRSQN